MGILANFIASVSGRLFTFISAYFSINVGLRLTLIATLAASYFLVVNAFNAFIGPLLAVLFSTEFGQFLGLAFPPAAGIVISGLLSLWSAVLTYRYYLKMSGILVR